MTITRHHTGQRMSQIVVHNDTVYLAGQVDGVVVNHDLAHALAGVVAGDGHVVISFS